jgi:hypothetical protein
MTADLHTAPDFLTRLVDKTLGIDGGITPRMRSLFEPAQEFELDASQLWPEAQSAEVAPQPEGADSGAHRRSVRAADDRPHLQRDDLLPTERLPRAPLAISQQEHRPDAAPDQGTAPAEPRPGSVTAPDQDTVRAERTRRPAPAAVPAQNRPATGERGGARIGALAMPLAFRAARPDETNATAPQPEFAPPAAPALLPTRVDWPAGPEARSPMPAASIPERAATLLTSARRAAIQGIPPIPGGPQQPRWEERRAEQNDQTAGPIINVTIGRVEVRAVPAPATKSPRAAPGPQPLSLDEYLKRRGAR